jgi:hypothetical protein
MKCFTICSVAVRDGHWNAAAGLSIKRLEPSAISAGRETVIMTLTVVACFGSCVLFFWWGPLLLLWLLPWPVTVLLLPAGKNIWKNFRTCSSIAVFNCFI